MLLSGVPELKETLFPAPSLIEPPAAKSQLRPGEEYEEERRAKLVVLPASTSREIIHFEDVASNEGENVQSLSVSEVR
jgi:hypothetical protein